MTAPLRIANCSGFYGDRLAAAREMVEGGPIDVLTGDWLAELTMLVLAKNMSRDNGPGHRRPRLRGPGCCRRSRPGGRAGSLPGDGPPGR